MTQIVKSEAISSIGTIVVSTPFHGTSTHGPLLTVLSIRVSVFASLDRRTACNLTFRDSPATTQALNLDLNLRQVRAASRLSPCCMNLNSTPLLLGLSRIRVWYSWLARSTEIISLCDRGPCVVRVVRLYSSPFNYSREELYCTTCRMFVALTRCVPCLIFCVSLRSWQVLTHAFRPEPEFVENGARVYANSEQRGRWPLGSHYLRRNLARKLIRSVWIVWSRRILVSLWCRIFFWCR